jgi:hypothetical protein
MVGNVTMETQAHILPQLNNVTDTVILDNVIKVGERIDYRTCWVIF